MKLHSLSQLEREKSCPCSPPAIAFIQKRKLWIGSPLPSWRLFESPLHIQKRQPHRCFHLHGGPTQRKGILTLFLFSYFGMIQSRITHFWPIWTSFKVDSLDANHYCIENLPHIGRQGSHLTIRYYHQDLHWCMIQMRSLSVSLISNAPLRGQWNASHQLTKGRTNISLSLCRLYVGTLLAPLIFKAVAFVRRVFTHSLADSNFHGHSPNVFIQQHFLWFLIMSVQLRHI